MGRIAFRNAGAIIGLLIGVILVGAGVAVPALLFLLADEETLARWALVGQALTIVGVFFSGIAFIGIALALVMQQRELANQHSEIDILKEEQRRYSELSLRQLHTDIIKMAINDRDLLSVWPPTASRAATRKKDQYCNLILNLQKVAYETNTIELEELRGALRFLMTSRQVYSFWQRAREARIQVTGNDPAEDDFTAEVDRAFQAVRRSPRSGILSSLREIFALALR